MIPDLNVHLDVSELGVRNLPAKCGVSRGTLEGMKADFQGRSKVLQPTLDQGCAYR